MIQILGLSLIVLIGLGIPLFLVIVFFRVINRQSINRHSSPGSDSAIPGLEPRWIEVREKEAELLSLLVILPIVSFVGILYKFSISVTASLTAGLTLVLGIIVGSVLYKKQYGKLPWKAILLSLLGGLIGLLFGLAFCISPNSHPFGDCVNLGTELDSL